MGAPYGCGSRRGAQEVGPSGAGRRSGGRGRRRPRRQRQLQREQARQRREYGQREVLAAQRSHVSVRAVSEGRGGEKGWAVDPVLPAPAPPIGSRTCDRVSPHPVLPTRIALCLFSPTPTPISTPGAENAASPHKSRRLRLCRARRRLLFGGLADTTVPRGCTVGRPEGEPETFIWA